MRIFAILDGDQPLQYHNAPEYFLFHPDLQLACHRQTEDIGKKKTIDCCNECSGNTRTQFGGIGKVTHNVDKAENCTDNTDSRRVTTSRLKELNGMLGMIFIGHDISLKCLTKFLWVNPINNERYTLLDERVAG